MVSLRKSLSLVSDKKNKEKERDLRVPSPEKTPPPSYSAKPDLDQDVVGQIRQLNLNFESVDLSNSLPTNDACIAHLKLLTAFAQLREDISTSNGLFDLHDCLAQSTGSTDNTALVKIREKRWTVYVVRAVDRFQVWWSSIIPGAGKTPSLRMDDCMEAKRLGSLLDASQKLHWSPSMLPPLDVLMVLHSFMLNPRNFLEDCLRYGMMPLWYAGFPWLTANTVLDSRSFEYTPGAQAVDRFESKTGLAWDHLQASPTREIICEGCQRPHQHPYTTATWANDAEYAFESSRGYADKDFLFKCSDCGHTVNHQSLTIAKFRRDMQRLVDAGTPMPGTILSLEGRPDAAKSPDPRKHEVFFPNRLLLAGLSIRIFDLTRPENNSHALLTTDNLRKAIEGGLNSQELVSKANGKFGNVWTRKLRRTERVAVRRMMSNYWENSSPFALDLVGAVLRQGIFVQKMKDIDWIHSPALESTVSRLILKYGVFFHIMETNPSHIAVPTLDVDLAWHTHQLSPPAYFEYSTAHTQFRQFIDHDDKIDENKLSVAFEWTSQQYHKLTDGDVYSECTCWYCEAIREAHTLAGLFSSRRGGYDKALALHDRKDISSDPTKNLHISTHNAVKAENVAAKRIAEAQAYKLDADYHRAVKRARKAGKTPPNRSEYTTAYVWGYPMYVPMWLPYGPDMSISGGMYGGNPCSINTSAGAVGNCVAGACGGTVGAGSCAGNAGACGGGIAGGCGGGGGGCGGGGGGGCGGGGG